MKAVDSVNDEIRQISIHYETILSILDKIKEIKVGLDPLTLLENSRDTRRQRIGELDAER